MSELAYIDLLGAPLAAPGAGIGPDTRAAEGGGFTALLDALRAGDPGAGADTPIAPLLAPPVADAPAPAAGAWRSARTVGHAELLLPAAGAGAAGPGPDRVPLRPPTAPTATSPEDAGPAGPGQVDPAKSLLTGMLDASAPHTPALEGAPAPARPGREVTPLPITTASSKDGTQVGARPMERVRSEDPSPSTPTVQPLDAPATPAAHGSPPQPDGGLAQLGAREAMLAAPAEGSGAAELPDLAAAEGAVADEFARAAEAASPSPAPTRGAEASPAARLDAPVLLDLRPVGGGVDGLGERGLVLSDPQGTLARAPEWVRGVADQLGWMATQDVGQARLRLWPRELGMLDIQISMDADRIRVAIETTSAQVRDELLDAQPRLRQLFADNGLSLGEMDVGTSDGRSAGEGNPGSPKGGADRGPSGEGQGVAGASGVGMMVAARATASRLVDLFA